MILLISVPDAPSLQSSGPCRHYAGGTVHLDGDGLNGDNEGGEVCTWPGERCPYLDSRSVTCPILDAPVGRPVLRPGQRVRVLPPSPFQGIEGRVLDYFPATGTYLIKIGESSLIKIGESSLIMFVREEHLGVLG